MDDEFEVSKFNSNKLSGFLIEDFKDTSSHLKATDQKVAFNIQIYSGALVLFLSIIIGIYHSDIDGLLKLLDIPSAILIIMYIGYTIWVYDFALKGIETKQLYLKRMNLFRFLIHNSLDSNPNALNAYWTSDLTKNKQNANIPQQGVQKKEKESDKVGLDNLYIKGLKNMGSILFVAFFYIVYRIIKNIETPLFIKNCYIGHSGLINFILGVLCMLSIYTFRQRLEYLETKSKRKIEKRIIKLGKSNARKIE